MEEEQMNEQGAVEIKEEVGAHDTKEGTGESDEDYMDADEDDDEEEDDDEMEGGGEGSNPEGSQKKKKKKIKKKTYLPGMKVGEGEELICDETAYVTLHTFTTTAPCLSFDIIPDGLASERTKFPLTAYAIAGTQAQRSHGNNILVMKMSNVYKTQPKSSDDELSSDESEDEGEAETELTKKPELAVALVPHNGCVNRIRFWFFSDKFKMVETKPLAATWSELGSVAIWDLTTPLTVLDDYKQLTEYIKNKQKPKPIFVFKGHHGEGYAIDWCPTVPGVLATGDSKKFIHVWHPNEGGWAVDQRPFTAHTASVEDIQWSPTEPNVFASCSVDKSIRVWDARAKPNAANMLTVENAHEQDVNVIHWNPKDPFIASGGDDGALRIWDLRNFTTGSSVAEFKNHHKGPVCSVEWSPHESTTLASAGEDDQVAIWDLAMERDPEATTENDLDVPAQLMFVHQGQQDIKELHWHPQIPGFLISTSATGFNVFKPANL